MLSTVDVVIPCYNYGPYLRQCIETVLCQVGVSVRILVIDDSSTDDTAQIGQECANSNCAVEFRRHLVNLGHIATYNEGIEWATATYLVILSADDYLLPESLKKATTLMDKHGDVTFTFGNVRWLESTGATAEVRPLATGVASGYRVLAGKEFIELAGATNIVPTPSVVVRTAVQKQAGGYRPQLPHSGDMEMWLRLATLGKVGFVDATQAVYRRHDNNMSNMYTVQYPLLDSQQRKLALDWFFKESASRLGGAEQLQKRMYAALGVQTVGCASAAFNRGQYETARDLARLAERFSSEVRWSLRWATFKFKCMIGFRASNTLRGMIAFFKTALSNYRSERNHASAAIVRPDV